MTLDTLCKVRGPKVIVNFLDNEARYVEPMLAMLLNVSEAPTGQSEDSGESDLPAATTADLKQVADAPWQLRYILLLWLSHLMLTPFDLSSIGNVDPALLEDQHIQLPERTPSIAQAILNIAVKHLASSTKEQVSAARLMVSTVLRPDTRRIGVLNSLMKHLLQALSSQSDGRKDLFLYTGYLRVIYGILRSAASDDIHQYLPPLHECMSILFGPENKAFQELQKSAVLKVLASKIHRVVIVRLLQIDVGDHQDAKKTSNKMLQDLMVMEDVIDALLTSLADRDTHVRLAASKSLSVIASKLEGRMAEEVVEAVLGSLKEDVRDTLDGKHVKKDLSAVNPLRWHGLTMTLGHMLFRRSASPNQLGEVLNAFYSSLVFEQRTTSGSSLGVNVRDAANFGLWSLARRYSTAELLAVNMNGQAIQAAEVSTVQMVATHLLVAACLDSSGNVRRGSSAALQELIGRHPDTVIEGIAVVQVVDYQAVGLRRRAMTDIAFETAQLTHTETSSVLALNHSYRNALWEGLLGWRGLQAPDIMSRNFAASSLAKLSNLLESTSVSAKISALIERLKAAEPREVEMRHGIIQALSSILASTADRLSGGGPPEDLLSNYGSLDAMDQLWVLFNDTLAVSPQDLSRASMRPELTTSGTVHLIGALSVFRIQRVNAREKRTDLKHGPADIMPMLAASTLTTCIKTADPSTLEHIPRSCCWYGLTLSKEDRMKLCATWLRELDLTKMTPRRAGFMTALASLAHVERPAPRDIDDEDTSSGQSSLWNRITARLSDMFWATEDVETRVTCLRCFGVMQEGPVDSNLDHFTGESKPVEIQGDLAKAIEAGLDDYTINERGDMGSMVRLEAIALLRRLVKPASRHQEPLPFQCYVTLHRLALERLDKVRLETAKALKCFYYPVLSIDISTFHYFQQIVRMFLVRSETQYEHPLPFQKPEGTLRAFWLGISSTAGLGSDALIHISRSALFTVLDSLPVYPSERTNMSSASNTRVFLHTTLTRLLTVLSTSLTNERTLLPLLETLSFLLDSGIFSKLTPPSKINAPASIKSDRRKKATGQREENIDRRNNREGEGKEMTNGENDETHQFKYLTCLSLTQKAHYKSTSLPKLLVCVQIYRGLVMLADTTTPTPLPDATDSSNSTNNNTSTSPPAAETTATHAATPPAPATGAERNPALQKLRQETLRKLTAMLAHPYSKVRVAVAEALYVVLGEEEEEEEAEVRGMMREVDWAGEEDAREVGVGGVGGGRREVLAGVRGVLGL